MSKSYTKEFKQEAVRLAETSGKPKAEIAYDLGISGSELYRWLKKYGEQPTPVEQEQTLEELKAELKRVKLKAALQTIYQTTSQGYQHA